jgi:uncharacterized protein (TIGR02147 family)
MCMSEALNPRAKTMADIFQYLNYCQFLNDALRERKKNNHHFSYRYISNFLNLKSPGFMNWVVHGRRKLPEALVQRIADLFKLNDREREYFALLVKYNHCTSLPERDVMFRQLVEFQKKKSSKIKPEQFKLFAKWYYLAIHELIRILPFKDDFQKLSVMLRPKIKSKEARDALEILQKNGLVRQDEDGHFKPIDALLTTGDAWESELIKNLQIELVEMGKKAIVSVPKQERDVSNLTFCASEKTMRRIADEIAALRQRILAMSENDHEADIVYQCNMQLFPISLKTRGERK